MKTKLTTKPTKGAGSFWYSASHDVREAGHTVAQIKLERATGRFILFVRGLPPDPYATRGEALEAVRRHLSHKESPT